MKIAFISPTKHIPYVEKNYSTITMALAHKVLMSRSYAENIKKSQNYIILDNSQYELCYSLSPEKIYKAANIINADCVVMPDGTYEGLELFKSTYLDVMFVPSGNNFMEDLVKAYNDTNIDFIGLSYEKAASYMPSVPKDEVRGEVLKELKKIISSPYSKKIHMLGMINKYELERLSSCELIHSWDSSMAVWKGLNAENLDSKKKYGKPLNFESTLPWNIQTTENIELIKRIIS